MTRNSSLDEISLSIGELKADVKTLKENARDIVDAREEAIKEFATLRAGQQAIEQKIDESHGRITILEPQVADYKRLKYIVIGGLGVITLLAGFLAYMFEKLIGWIAGSIS